MSDPTGPEEQNAEPTRKERIEAKLEKYRFIHNSRLGKKWQAYKAELQTTKSGKRKLQALNLVQGLGWIALLIWFKIFGYDFLFPADYNLTEKQQGEGYSRTLTSSYRNSHPEDVYYRFYKDNEMDLPDCNSTSSWCVFAIPLSKSCTEIAMEFKTNPSEESSDVIEEFDIAVQSKNGLPFVLGQRVTLNVESKDERSQYGLVDHIYCRSY